MTNKINLKGVKSCFVGIQGSGKTEAVKYFTNKGFKKPLVYAVHKYEWDNMSNKYNIYIPQSYDLKEFNMFCGNLIKGLKNREKDFDALIIDEADLFFQDNFQIYGNVNDLFINHRHYPKGKGIALILVTRRPQDIPAKVFESSEHLFVFAIEGENVKRKLENLSPQIRELTPYLSKDKHNYIYKQIGYSPKLCKAIQINRTEK